MDHSLQEQSALQEKARCEVQVGLVGAGTSGVMGTWGVWKLVGSGLGSEWRMWSGVGVHWLISSWEGIGVPFGPKVEP